MRSQWCREHIDETAEHCGIDESTVSEVKQAAQFCVEHPEYSDCSTMAILVLIRYPDMAVRDNATLSIKKSFDSGKHPLTGKIIKAKILTAKEVKKILEKEEIALRGEVVKVIKEAKKAEPAPVVKPEPAKPSPAGQTLTEKMAAQPQQPVFYKPDPAPVSEIVPIPAPITSQDPEKQRSSALNYYAKEFYKLLSERTKKDITDILTDNPTWEVKDVFFFGVQALIDKKNGAKK